MSAEHPLVQFRSRHPLGGVITELLKIEQGLYVVRAEISLDRTVLGSGLASAEAVEDAEDRAILRALSVAGFIVERALPSLEERPRSPSVTLLPQEEPRRERSAPVYTLPPDRNFDPKYDPDEEDTSLDLSELIAATDVELKRIGWDNAQGKAHLSRTYGKATRKQLSEEELRDFLVYLRKQGNYNNRRAQETPF